MVVSIHDFYGDFIIKILWNEEMKEKKVVHTQIWNGDFPLTKQRHWPPHHGGSVIWGAKIYALWID